MAITVGKQPKPQLIVSVDDILKEQSEIKLTRRKQIAKNQIWRERLSKNNIIPKIAGCHAISKGVIARVSDIYSTEIILANTGTEANPKMENVPVVYCSDICKLGRRVSVHRHDVLTRVKVY